MVDCLQDGRPRLRRSTFLSVIESFIKEIQDRSGFDEVEKWVMGRPSSVRLLVRTEVVLVSCIDKLKLTS
jgi:hypothetical protein